MILRLLLELHKSLGQRLDFTKLVKKPVQVHGQDGKVFTRYQWVNPSDLSTGHGVRRITSKAEMSVAKMQGIHKHPDFQEAMQHHGVDVNNEKDTRYLRGAPLYLPETEDSAKAARLFSSKGHFRHGEQVDSPAPKPNTPRVEEDTSSEVKPHLYPLSEGETPDSAPAYKRYSNDPRVHKLVDAIHSLDVSQAEMSSEAIEVFASHLKSNSKTMNSMLSEHIMGDKEADEFTKVVQMRNLGMLEETHTGYTIAHPTVARAIVDKVLGKEFAAECRKAMEMANLTINCPEKAVNGIQKSGYVASTMLGYAEKQLDPKALERFMEVYQDTGHDTDTFIGALKTLKRSLPVNERGAIYAIEQRCAAEYEKIGLHAEDPKPCYLALNPAGSRNGSVPYYGDAHFIIDPKVLPNCTMATADTFSGWSFFAPKVHDLDHLKDSFLIRQMECSFGFGDPYDWLHSQDESDIRMELHYHRPVMDKKHLRLGSMTQEDDY